MALSKIAKLGPRVNALSLFSVLSADFFIDGPERMIKSEIWDLPIFDKKT